VVGCFWQCFLESSESVFSSVDPSWGVTCCVKADKPSANGRRASVRTPYVVARYLKKRFAGTRSSGLHRFPG
jgi:hypothetical protein